MKTWTAGELAAELRFVPPDTELYIVGTGNVEGVRAFGTRLRPGAQPLLRAVFGIRLRANDDDRQIAYIEGKSG